MEPWVNDLKDSSYDFVRVVWPVLEKTFFAGFEIIPNELLTAKNTNDIAEKLAVALDQLAGIDYFVVRNRKGMKSIASRVQWGSINRFYPPNSFTIRKERITGGETEYKKRLDSIDNGFICPYYTVQAYVSDPRKTGELLTFAVVKTEELFKYIRNGDETGSVKILETKDKSAKFFVVYWDEYERSGNSIYKHTEQAHHIKQGI